MRTSFRLLAIVTVLLLLVAACGSSDTETNEASAATAAPTTEAPATTGAPAATETTETAALLAEDTMVCFVYNSFADDAGWAFAHDRGRLDLEASLGVTTAFVDGIFDTGGTDGGKVFEEFANQGCQVILGTSFGYNDAILEVAARYPDVTFSNFDQYVISDNVGSHRMVTEEVMYLNGIAAGMMTESNSIGMIGTFPIPQIIRNINGFALGVQSVNPEATVQVVWLNSWFDPALETQAANGLIESGADVVAHLASSSAAIQAAEEQGVYSIGYQNDQREFGPEFNITSLVFEWGPLYEDIVRQVLDGSWTAQETWYGLADGVLRVGDFGPSVPSDVVIAVEEAETAFVSGGLAVFTGPVTDQDGTVRIAEGETMNLGDIAAIDWLVEGVIGSAGG